MDDRVSSKCRICNGMPLVFIFEPDVVNGKTLAELMAGFANVTIEQNDGKPSYLCSECTENLHKSVAFRKQIQDAEMILQDVRENQYCLSPELQNIKIERSPMDDDDFEYEYLEEDTLNEINKKEGKNLHQNLGLVSETTLLISDQWENQEANTPFEIPENDRIAQRLIFDDFEYFEIDGERCCGCNFIASCRDELVKHSKESHAHNYYPDSSYTCPICYHKYKTQELLTKHIEYYSYSDIFLCKVCNEPFVQRNQLEEHQKVRHKHDNHMKSLNNELSKKVDNTKKTTRIATRRKHVVSVKKTNGDKYFCCFVRCWEGFEKYDDLLEHVNQIHNGKRRENELAHVQALGAEHVCPICKRQFENKSKLEHHRSYKQNRVTHFCQECGQSFYKLHALRDHEIKQHSQQPPEHECDICGKAFLKMSVLKHHRKIHVPFESVPCVEAGCQLVFRDEALMKRHCRNVHGDNFPWECGFCPKKLRTKEAMDIHVRVHTGEKPFACRQGCERRFAHATDRARHERSKHTGEKPHKCEQCPAAYVRRRELVVHMNKNHNSE
ncbi:oocyte zinc finger protein XlCOF6-like isoform X2 [Wyeomyia smithii]|uniref:oocyte zinc finger protein XlCOF6-like isoform X2 n=2 Tax=Wyeomyia smithii TaxID=174621 RepID=UPI002467FA81|nr:oocyte zinc finger protein XlCOF6-like isoform X2 [Wyeomyia smithii]